MTPHDRTLASSNADRERTRRGRFQAVACCFAAFFCATTAGAQSPPSPVTGPATPAAAEPTAEAVARANKLFGEASTQLEAAKDAADYAAACAKFEESQKLADQFGAACNIVKCELGQKHYAAALRKSEECLPLLDKKSKWYEWAAKNKADAENKVGRLELRISAPAPPGMEVALDGRTLGPAELATAIVVDPGSHRIVVTAQGYEPRDWMVTANSEETRPVNIKLDKRPEPPDKTSEPVKTSLPPVTTSEPLPPGFFSQHQASLATLGAGVVLAAVGTGLALDIVGSRFHDYIQSCQRPEGCSKVGKEALETESSAVNALFPIAGLAALTAVGLFIFAEGGPKAHPTTQAHVTVGPTGVSLTVRR